MSVISNPTEQLNIDNTLDIFARLEPQDIVQCSQVNKKWQIVTRDDSLWLKVVPNLGDIVKINIKDYIDSQQVVTSKKQLIRYAKACLNMASPGSKITCSFPFNSGCKFSIEIEVSKDQVWTHNESKHQVDCIFLKAIDGENHRYLGEGCMALTSSSLGFYYHAPKIHLSFETRIDLAPIYRFFGIPFNTTYLHHNKEMILPQTGEMEDNNDNVDITSLVNTTSYHFEKQLEQSQKKYFFAAIGTTAMALAAGTYALYRYLR